MTKHFLTLACALLALALPVQAQYPSVDPSATYVTIDGDETDDASQGQDAPLEAHFSANPSNVGNYTARYEWKIYEPGQEETPVVHRFEENLDYTFTHSGSYYVQLYATFTLDGDTITYPEEGESNPFVVSISESKLELPNAFSPNDDGFNDTYKVKEYQSIISFQAAIFNRWGQKIYSWDDLEGSWDGKWHGRTVKDGVYFVVVDARGADGRHYKVKKAVNVLTGYRNDSQNGGNNDE